MTCSSGPCSPVKTQCDFQLHAMVHAIEQMQTSIAERTDSPTRITVQRHGQTLIAKATASARLANTRYLSLTPLFAGSYTQPDVAIQCLDSEQAMHANSEPANPTEPSCCLHPIAPAFHFAQFNRLPASLSLEENTLGKRVVVLASDFLNTADAEEQLTTPPHSLAGIIREHPDCNLVVIDLQHSLRKRSFSESRQRMQQRIRLHRQAGALPVQTKIVTVPDKAVTIFFTLLSQADIIYAPTIGMTIDALNAGCHIISGNHSTMLREHETDNLDAARQALAVEQMRRIQADKLIHSVHELHSHLYQWLQPADWSKWSEPMVSTPIIPLNVRTQRGGRNSLASAKAKLRKLHRSPGQFLQDSRFPLLRKLGTS